MPDVLVTDSIIFRILYLEEVPKFISNLKERLNYSVHVSTGKMPIIALEKEKVLTITTECECKKLI